MTIIYQRKWLVFWVTVLATVLAFDIAIIQAANYKASATVLVVQKRMANQDIYTISKSAQTLARVLKEGIYSDSFFEKVVNSAYEVDESDFPIKAKDRKKEWQKTVKANIVRDLGVLEIDVYFEDKEKAESISRAVVAVLKENHQLYHGAGDMVDVRVLDYPTVSENPDMTRVYLATLFGAFAGFLIGTGLVLKKTGRYTEKGW